MLSKLVCAAFVGLPLVPCARCLFSFQQPVLPSPPSLDPTLSETDSFVGMDLTSCYGTVAVAFSNGTKVNVAKVQGSDAYSATMQRLSLESSQHVTPPYSNYDQMHRDAARQAERKQRKAQGLPASQEVEVLADMLSTLRTAAEHYLGHHIGSALAACPNLIALYREDMEDAFEYLSLETLDNPNNLYPLFREPSGAEANYGVGICADPSNTTHCKEIEQEFPFTAVITILYTVNALCVEVSVMKSAYAYASHPTTPSSMDFTLGSGTLHDNPDEEYYWQAVKDRLLTGFIGGLPGFPLTNVFLLGDDSLRNKRFRSVLDEAVNRLFRNLPEIRDEDPLFSAARGAAEFARRGGYVF